MLQNAQSIGRKHSSSSAIHDAMNPVRGIRDEITRKGGVPKNHFRENQRQLKALQEKVKQKKQSDELEAQQKKTRATGSADKFTHVPSRLYLSTGSAGTRGTSASASDSRSAPSSGGSTRAKAPVKPNFNTSGRAAAPPAKAGMTRSASSGSITTEAPVPERKTALGKMPKYLTQRKEEWAREEEEKRQRQIEQETWPPGTVPVPEEERLSTLAYLQQSQKALLLELSRFPITLQPSNVQRYKRKQEVEEKLREIEKGIDVYSQERVFMTKM
ncbi:Enkurin domain-containing protein 1 [Allomyces javanicus]|nr:Enkurin domain-containing protein 1 [Allomyces javanicus]